MLTQVRLYGHLGREFGRVHNYDIETAAEVVSALNANHPGFRHHLLQHAEPGYRVLVNDEPQTAERLALVVGVPSVIKIVPVIRGAGDGKGIGMIIGGVLLTIASYGAAAGWFGAAIAGSSAWGAAATIGMGLGVGMAASGVSTLLSPQPKTADVEQKEAERKRAFTFSSSADTLAQGTPMPIRFGRQFIEGYPVSVRMEVVHDLG